MIEKIKRRWYFIPAGIIILILFIVGSVCDLQIAKGMYWEGNYFSRIFAALSSLPVGIVFGYFAGSLFRMGLTKFCKKTYQNILLYVIAIVVFIAGLYFIGRTFTDYHGFNLDKISKILAFPFGLIFVGPGAFLGYYLYPKMDHNHLIRNYLFVAITLLLVIGLAYILKVAIPRMRYTSINQFGDQYYAPWYSTNSYIGEFIKSHPNIEKEELRSFPSGHTATAFMTSFILTSLSLFFPKFKGKEAMLFNVGFVFTLIIALSRMLFGAHYLSDTMFACILCIAIFFIANEIRLRKFKDKIITQEIQRQKEGE